MAHSCCIAITVWKGTEFDNDAWLIPVALRLQCGKMNPTMRHDSFMQLSQLRRKKPHP